MKGSSTREIERHCEPVNEPRGDALFQVVAQIEAQGHRSCRQYLMMLDHFVLFPGDCADNNRFYAQIEQVRNLVRDGLACCAAIHVEAVGKYQPDLFIVRRSYAEY